MDFEKLRKDMKKGSPGPFEVEDDMIRDRDGDAILDSTFMREADARRFALVWDLAHIALAAEKYRKADEEVKAAALGLPLGRALGARADARAELFALLTSKDAT